MLTAISRVAARRVLLPSRTTASKFATQLPRGSVAYRLPNASNILAAARSLTVSAWMRSPAKTSSSSKKKKTSTTTKKKKTKKATATKKKTKKAAAPKKKTKKVLAPEEKAKAELRELKKIALLKRPALLPEQAWVLYVSNNRSAGGKATEQMKELSSGFAKLSESEKESLKSKAQSNFEANQKARQQWVESQPVEAIYMANIARRRIARKTNKSRLFLIHDERLPRRPRTSYALFIKSRFNQVKSQSGSSSAKDAFRAISEEWRSMSESEKQPFREAAALEMEKATALLKELKDKTKVYWKAQGGSVKQVPL